MPLGEGVPLERGRQKGVPPLKDVIFPLLALLHCVPKNIPGIFDCNVKKDYRILIIFGTNIYETTFRQVTI